MSAETHPLTFIDPVCGKPWVHTARVFEPTDTVLCEPFEHLDGTPMHRSDPIRCESCGRLGSAADLHAMTEPSNFVQREASSD